MLSDYGLSVFGTTVDSRDADDTRDRDRWSLNYRFEGRFALADRVEATVYRQLSDTSQTTREQRTTRTRAKQSRRRESSYEQQIAGDGFSSTARSRWASPATSSPTGPTTRSPKAPRSGTAGRSTAREHRFGSSRRYRPATSNDGGHAACRLRTGRDHAARRAADVVAWRPLRSIRRGCRRRRHLPAGNPGSPTPEDYADSEATATVGVLYNLTDRIAAYARFSQGFRAPPYDDVNVGFTNFLGGYKTIANPDLESERSDGVEVGARIVSTAMNARVVYFRNTYENFIESFALAPQFLASRGIDPADGMLTFQSVNRPSVEIDGLEVGGASICPTVCPRGSRWRTRGARMATPVSR